jgi:hypothetical protein
VTDQKKTESKRTRDPLGRWLKKVSGNPKGRPPDMARVDHGDLLTFKNEVRLVNTRDGKILMTREAAVLHRLYEAAMKGNVHAQIFLTRRFEKYYRDTAGIAVELRRIVSDIRKQKRPPTDYEAALLEGAMDALDPSRRLKDGPQMVHAGQFRPGKRKPKITRPRGNPDD